MKAIAARARALLPLLLAACCGGAQAQAPTEVAARNAAAGFMLSSLATLGMLRDECEALLGPGPAGAPAIARGWWDRNRPGIEVAYVWTDRYLQALRQGNPARYQEVASAIGKDTAEAVQSNAAKFFRGQLPTADSCRAALKLFGPDDPGDPRFTEATRTLQAIRGEAGFAVPPHITLDPERSLHYEMSASLLAAQDAVQRRDADAVRQAFGSMAQRGDARAAFQLGAMHMRGDVVEKDDAQAYRWFHQAWRLRDAEGANALGAMHRDGQAGPADQRLALALFQLAVAQARDPRTKARAERNLTALARRMPAAEQDATACMRLRQIAEGVDQPLPPAERGHTRFDAEPERRLGEFLPPLFGGLPPTCPR